MRRATAYRLAAAVITIVVASWILKSTFASAARIQWNMLDPWLLVAALLVSSLQECAGTTSAQAALAAFAQRASFFRLLIITTVATTTNSAVPVPAGIPLRIWLQKRWLGIPVSSSTAAVALEMLCGYGTLGLFALAGTFLFGPSIVALGFRYGIAVAVIFLLVVVTTWLLRNRIRARIGQLAGLRPALVPAIATIALNLGIIGLATLRLWLILRALEHQATPVVEITAALCISRLVGVASMIPMGLGSRDVTLTGLLVLASVPLPIAIIAAAVDRVLATIPYLAVALAGWPLLRRSGVTKPSSNLQ